VLFVLRRLAATLPTLVGAITFAFLLIRVAPGDPARLILGDEYQNSQALLAVRAKLGLDRPIAVQYVDYVSDILRGNFGESFRTGQGVLPEILSQVPSTVTLAFAAILVAVAIGVPVGALAALRRNTWIDYVSLTTAMLALAAPSFWFGILLIFVFSFTLGWFPIFGAGQPGNLLSMAHALVLPAVAIGARSAALVARMARSSLLEVLNQDYIRTARAKGIAQAGVVRKHALRNAVIPVLTIIGIDIAYLLGGSVVVEFVFARPGLGKLLVDAIYTRDYPVVQGAILVFSFAIVLVNVIIDLVYGLVDPRIRYG
jgi:ABC-type dipeptide/oligopeptide/nickel transport system permease component